VAIWRHRSFKHIASHLTLIWITAKLQLQLTRRKSTQSDRVALQHNPPNMSAFSSFLNKGTAPATPAQTPFSGTSTTPAQPPPAPAQPAIPLSNIPGPITSSTPFHSGTPAAMRLREIAQQSQKLNDNIRAGSSDLPKLELSLGMIREKARDMSRRAGGANRDNMQQA
jgi:hypothetical protein